MKPLIHPKLSGPELVIHAPLTSHVEAMQIELEAVKDQRGMHLAAENVRAALRCGLVSGAADDSVGTWPPAFTLWVSEQVTRALEQSLEVPPE